MSYLERVNVFVSLIFIFTVNFLIFPTISSAAAVITVVLVYGAVSIFTSIDRMEDLEAKVSTLKSDTHAMLVEVNWLKANHVAIAKQAEETKKVLSSGNLQAAFVPRNKRSGATNI